MKVKLKEKVVTLIVLKDLLLEIIFQDSLNVLHLDVRNMRYGIVDKDIAS